ncbi:MAG: iron ABC transporter permease, partial [Phycisphaerae bacterium]|jgi:iron(III) transport system permease protein
VLFKTDAVGRTVMIALLLLVALFPLFVTGGAVLGAFRRDLWLESTLLAGVIHGLAHLPVATLIIGVGLRLVPAEYEEAALLEGAGALRTLLRVSLRTAWPAVAGAVLLVLLWTWTDNTITDVLLVRTFAEEVYTQYALRGRPCEPAAVAWPQVLIFGALLWTARKGLLHGSWAEAAVAGPRLFRLGVWRWPVSLAGGAFVLALVAAPVLSLSRRIENFGEAAANVRLFAPHIAVSAVTGLGAGLIAAGLAVGLAWQAARNRGWRVALGLYLAVMLALPAPVLAIGLIVLLNRPGWVGEVYGSPVILVMACAIRFLPVAVIAVAPAVRAVPIEREMAARVDGCGTAGLWWRIIRPACTPAAVGAAFLVVVLSLGELPCAVLVCPPGYEPVSVRFNSLIHYGLYADSATLCLMSAGAVVVPWLVLLILLRGRLLR